MASARAASTTNLISEVKPWEPVSGPTACIGDTDVTTPTYRCDRVPTGPPPGPWPRDPGDARERAERSVQGAAGRPSAGPGRVPPQAERDDAIEHPFVRHPAHLGGLGEI